MDEKTLREQLLKVDTPEAHKTVSDIEAQAQEIKSLKTQLSGLRKDDAEKTSEKEAEQLQNQISDKEKQLKQSLSDGMSQLNFKTDTDHAVLYAQWSGWVSAKSFCEKPGNEKYQRIETTPGGKWLQDLELDKCFSDYNDKREVWKTASLEYVDGISGRARAHATAKHQDSIFWQDEYPRLKENKDCNGVTFVRPEGIKVNSVQMAQVSDAEKNNQLLSQYERVLENRQQQAEQERAAQLEQHRQQQAEQQKQQQRGMEHER